MAITSVGYPGPVDAGEWAELAASLGADYGVFGAGDLRVSTVPAADRTVKIAAGSGYGRGILDVSSAEETVQLDTLVSGTRWDLIVLKRTWAGGSSATTIEKITGTSSQTAVFALRETTPGTEDDQPIALVQITAGNTVPTAVVDLRAWQANGGAVAADILALQYLNGAGTEVWVGSDLWHRYVDGAGALQWAQTNARYVLKNGLTGASAPAGSVPLIQAFPVQDVTASGIKAITFPEAFASPPVVSAISVNYIGTNPVVPSSLISTTGCTLYWPGTSAATFLVNIIAIGWRP